MFIHSSKKSIFQASFFIKYLSLIFIFSIGLIWSIHLSNLEGYIFYFIHLLLFAYCMQQIGRVYKPNEIRFLPFLFTGSIFVAIFCPQTFYKYLFQVFFLLLYMDFFYIAKHKFIMFNLMLVSLAIWSFQVFGLCQIDQLFTLLQFGQAGVLTGDIDIAIHFIFNVLLFPLLISIGYLVFVKIFRACFTTQLNNLIILKLIACSAFVLNLLGITDIFRALIDFFGMTQQNLFIIIFYGILLIFLAGLSYFKLSYNYISGSLGIFVLGLFCVNQEFGVSNYLSPVLQDSKIDYFQQAYKDPRNVKFTANSQAKSLILIYVESLESTYQNKNIFKRNLLAPLSELKYPTIQFKQFDQVSNTGWTMAGILASQCGVPFKLITPYGRNTFGMHVKHFMSGAWCLGDILNSLGYDNIFMNGSSLEFAGQGLFFKTHHYDELYGRDEWSRHGYSPSNLDFWGLADDKLFAEAKLKLTQLMQAHQLFNLTLLTIDTHGLDGRLSETCKQRGGNSFEDIVECTSFQVADFVDYVAKQGWLDKVSIVITGDHLAMANAVSHQLNQSPQHYIYNLFITDNKLDKTRDSIVHFDLLPSILHSIGIQWDDDKLGLGYSALGLTHPKLESENRVAKLNKIILSPSKAYNHLWLQ